MRYPLLLANALLAGVASVHALGTACTAPLGAGTAAAGAPYWIESIAHQGTAPYSSNPSTYPIFRNVKSYGAKGDGVTDDTAAINAAISAGSRCGIGCDSTTTSPALVYFPQGTYVVSSPIIALYYTVIMGDARVLPTIVASAGFSGMAVIDADPYIPNGYGAQYYTNQNNFFRSVRNLVIDLRRTPVTASTTGLHWQVSQATSLYNIRVEMSTDPATNHQGMFMENGSGGFMGDLIFNGGRYGVWVGNQQFTVRNSTFNNVQGSAVYMNWNWGWTFQGVTINNCNVGFDINTGGLTVDTQTSGAEVILDAVVTNTPIFVRTSNSNPTSLSGSLLIDNARLSNVATAAVYNSNGNRVVLAGGTTTIALWGQGNIYSGTSNTKSYNQGPLTPPSKPSVLLDSAGRVFGRGHPTYADYSVDQVVSARANGAVGDGVTDDTTALTNLFAKYAGCKIIYIDAGTYYVTNTILIPVGAQVIGEAWSVIIGGGSAFSNVASPKVVIQAGASGSVGTLELSDLIFATRGPAPGAIVLEWNAAQGAQGSTGTWDSHVRLGAAQGTNLGSAQCNKAISNTGATCYAAFMGIHLTAGSSVYLEGLWSWLGDHDLDGDHGQLTTYSGRGILSESKGPVWMVGTGSEHHVIYNYGIIGGSNCYIGLAQVESPYWQPLAAALSAAPASSLPQKVAGNSSISDVGAQRGQAAVGKQSKRSLSSRAIPAGWTDGGCVVDTAARILTGLYTTSTTNSPSSCIATCDAQGFTIAGLEYGQECYCGNSFVGGTPATASSSDCNTVCPGDSTAMCGAGWRLNIYTKSASTPPSTGSGPFPVNSAFNDPTTLPASSWGLYVRSSSGILVYGAGLYSFFDKYAQTCLDTLTCQNSIIDIDSASQINIYSLSTVGVTNMLASNGVSFATAQDNANGFQSTVTAWYK